MEFPCVHLDDIAGLEEAKDALLKASRQHLSAVSGSDGGRTGPRSILLYGVPGTGKTFLFQALAGVVGSSQFHRHSSSDMVSKWLGQNQERVREVFARARTHQPSVLCLDDMEGFCGAEGETAREEARLELLRQMQGAVESNSGLLVLGATAVPWRLDPEVRQRFERCVCIPVLNEDSRALVFKKKLSCVSNNLTEADFISLAQKTEGFTGADIVCAAHDALLQPIRRVQRATHFRRVRGQRSGQATEEDDLLTPCCPGDAGAMEMTWEDVGEELAEPIICMEDVLKALEDIKPSVDQTDLEEMRRFTDEVQTSADVLVQH